MNHRLGPLTLRRRKTATPPLRGFREGEGKKSYSAAAAARTGATFSRAAASLATRVPSKKCGF